MSVKMHRTRMAKNYHEARAGQFQKKYNRVLHKLEKIESKIVNQKKLADERELQLLEMEEALEQEIKVSAGRVHELQKKLARVRKARQAEPIHDTPEVVAV